MSEAIAAVVFDLDGVLVDSKSVWDAARREVVLHSQLGVPLEPEQINELVVAALI